MYSVLIVDDDKLARKGLIAITDWAKCGMQVVGDVANGKLAMDFLAEHQVDLAVVDMVMPVMNGLEFIRESSRLYPQLQYVMLSFHEDFEYVKSALRLGALDYISKLRIEEDCTQSFMSISNMLERKLRHLPVEPTRSGISASAYEELCTRWRKLYWVYNHYTFTRMMEQLESAGLDAPQTGRLIVLIENDLRSAFGYAPDAPFTGGAQEARHFLTALRDGLCARVLQSPDFHLMPHCILFAALYIQQNTGSRLKEQQVAQLVGMSRSYFSQNFSAMAGATLSRFLRGVRMDHAKKLLASGCSVADTASAVGYDDVKYFQQSFRSVTGESCSQFLKQNSQASDGGAQ